jgi:cysteine desulfurase
MIYLDNHATTPCDPEVIEFMHSFFGQNFGNPSSSIHKVGRQADNAVKYAREQVAELLGAKPKEIIFTSGATESNNIAIQGLVKGSDGTRGQIVTTPIEHKSILNQCKALEKDGWEIIYLPVDKSGTVKIEDAKKLITQNVLVVSVQTASNEIGTIQSIKDLSEIAHEKGAYFHTDAAQAVGKIPVRVNQMGIDLLSISAHKFYGPKGVGALYVRGGVYAMPIRPIVFGGEQEFNLRSGTLNVPGIVGLGKACELCQGNIEKELERIGTLRDLLESNLMLSIDYQRNGNLENRLPNNSNLTFKGIDAEALIVNMVDLAISTGSACTSGALEPSHVLQAIGINRNDANSTVRIGLGRFTTEDEIKTASAIILENINKLRAV